MISKRSRSKQAELLIKEESQERTLLVDPELENKIVRNEDG
jgi:hypothetical protein